MVLNRVRLPALGIDAELIDVSLYLDCGACAVGVFQAVKGAKPPEEVALEVVPPAARIIRCNHAPAAPVQKIRHEEAASHGS